MSEQQDLVPVFLTNAVATSAGPGPGPKLLPPAEAGALVARKMGIYGDQPPHGFAADPGRAASN